LSSVHLAAGEDSTTDASPRSVDEVTSRRLGPNVPMNGSRDGSYLSPTGRNRGLGTVPLGHAGAAGYGERRRGRKTLHVFVRAVVLESLRAGLSRGDRELDVGRAADACGVEVVVDPGLHVAGDADAGASCWVSMPVLLLLAMIT
jgi:hypothetical protein